LCFKMNECDKAESVAIAGANEREPWERYSANSSGLKALACI